MILREETFEKFGYYPEDLTPMSHKPIVVRCKKCGRTRVICKYDSSRSNNGDFCFLCTRNFRKGKRGPNFGKHFSEEHKKKISNALKGEKHYLYGKHHSEETKKKISDALKGEKNPFYGKHHSEESLEKIRRAHRGEKHHMFGKHLSVETRRKISAAVRGEKNGMYGKHHTEAAKKKMSESRKGKGNPMYGKHHTVEARRKMREARKKRGFFPRHRTKPELIFEEICKKYNLPFKYTGDGTLWIGKNPAINPDFVECNGNKIAVEIFSYWHDPIRRLGKVKYSYTYEGRKKILKKHGWKLVVFWEEDLEREDAEEFVLSVLKNSV